MGSLPHFNSKRNLRILLSVDDYTGMTWLYTAKHKSYVIVIVKNFHHIVWAQFSLPIKVFCFDNRGEYVNVKLSQFFNKKASRKPLVLNTSIEMGGRTDKLTYSWDGAFPIEVAAPQSYWADAVTYVVYVINRMLSKMLDFRTPLDVLTDHVSLPSSLNLTSHIFLVCSICSPSQESAYQA